MNYGELRHGEAEKLAREIHLHRPLSTTFDLHRVIAKTFGTQNMIRHSLDARVFQAVRIEVNDELDLIEQTLPIALKLLHKGGRLGVISFHSLEDRLVKTFFKDISEKGLESEAKILTKKPLEGKILDAANERARSAKFRAIEKL
jgi:16S rRNA (cytosine1402-N4)-methyltransferase